MALVEGDSTPSKPIQSDSWQMETEKNLSCFKFVNSLLDDLDTETQERAKEEEERVRREAEEERERREQQQQQILQMDRTRQYYQNLGFQPELQPLFQDVKVPGKQDRMKERLQDQLLELQLQGGRYPLNTSYDIGKTPLNTPAEPMTPGTPMTPATPGINMGSPFWQCSSNENSGLKSTPLSSTPVACKNLATHMQQRPISKVMSPIERKISLPATPPGYSASEGGRRLSPRTPLVIGQSKLRPGTDVFNFSQLRDDSGIFTSPTPKKLATNPSCFTSSEMKKYEDMNQSSQKWSWVYDDARPDYSTCCSLRNQGFPMRSMYPQDSSNSPVIDKNAVERSAQLHHKGAALSPATCKWRGQLPVKQVKNPAYSNKVFLGGVPWDITEASLQSTFSRFGSFEVEWPGKDGYVYLLFEAERSVRSLLEFCKKSGSDSDYYINVSSRRMRSKEIQVIPWLLSDSNKYFFPDCASSSAYTVFVGALHGMITAELLGNIMNDLFGKVLYAGIDTDKHKYPIGSGRVAFAKPESYIHAVSASFLEVTTGKFTKKLQIDPYLEDSECCICQRNKGTYFCRDLQCFQYFCQDCWYIGHNDPSVRTHQPVARTRSQIYSHD